MSTVENAAARPTSPSGGARTEAESSAADTSPAGTTTAPPARRSAWGRMSSAALTVVVVALLALAAAVVLVPRLLGAVPLTVLSGSMEPALSPGDVVVTRPVDADQIRVGDVITFQPESEDPTLITHRVTGVRTGAEPGFVTQGDANGAPDAPIVADQVMGRVAYSVPYVGHLTNASWAPQAVTGIAVLLIAYALVSVLVPARRPTTKEARDA
ncbi:signal peptidase I [Isoptericola sp. NPDC057559]|uniref:signal peptidase I n=1 Tax=Isoptericola sp. NPDC057559 TaxID=3346168 RepID=UPI0036BC96BA